MSPDERIYSTIPVSVERFKKIETPIHEIEIYKVSVVVIKQGVLDALQDGGRFGYQHLGINPGGAMDLIAARVANMLVGNESTCPVMELHFPSASLMFQETSLVAITGADFSPVVNDQPVAVNSSIIVPQDSVLKFNRYKKASRCYLAIRGGWKAERWLNSYSTNIKVSAGGYAGRSLRKNDVLQIMQSLKPFHPDQDGNPRQLVQIDISHLYSPTKKIRCVSGCEYEWLDDDSKNKFQASAFNITSESDRMGYRLRGDALKNVNGTGLLSCAVTRGTIQLLPSGQLIILMADHQTTGGYPRVAHVISADVPGLAQMHANEELGFELVTQAEAEKLFVQQQRALQQLEQSIKLQLQPYFV